MIDKKKLSRRFSKNASQYDRYAVVQKKMSHRIIDMIKDRNPLRILEIGCGTGYLTRLLLNEFPNARIKSVDIAPGMIEYASQVIESDKVEFECMDIEEMESSSEKYDLVVSNATFQWFNDLDGTSRKILESLERGGAMCFSTFGEKTFKELKESYCMTSAEMELEKEISPSQSFYSTSQLEAIYLDKGVEKFAVEESYEHEHFDSCMDFFNSVKKIGANNCQKERRKIDPDFVKRAIEVYEQEFRFQDGVRATYHNLHVIMEKL